VTKQLLSSSTDRGIIVWNHNAEDNKLMPNLCAIKELKSNLSASWNKTGDKFCVGGSSGHVFVGVFNPDLNFWVALSQTEEPPLGKPLHKASVTQVRFDPGSGRVVASASADGTVVVTSAYKEEIDTAPGTGPFGNVSDGYGEVLFRMKTNVWNNTLAWSPSGATLAFASHDCEVHFAEFTAEIVASKTKP
jgi:WD40 repeat protein